MIKRALVLGGGGFIGGHLVRRLQSEGYWVRSVDLKHHEYGAKPDEFIQGDLSDSKIAQESVWLSKSTVFDEVYQLAADMGGAGYIFTGENDADVMFNSATINLNILKGLVELKQKNNLKTPKIFYSSSACIYPESKQKSPRNKGLREEDAYPAEPDSEYGWEKLFSERLYMAFYKNHGIESRIARFHNIFGPEGTWQGGKEKAPAAICRKVALAESSGEIEIWGDGKQTRSFLYVEDCLDAVRKLMDSNYLNPVNIGSDVKKSINEIVRIAASFEGKNLRIRHIPGPQGVRGRNSDNALAKRVLSWEFGYPLEIGLRETYFWIKSMLQKNKQGEIRVI